MPRKKKQPKFDPAETPAKIAPGHTQGRDLTGLAGGPRGWRNDHEHPLTAAWRAEPPKVTAEQFAAGEAYRALFEMMGRGGRDSLDLMPGGRSGTPFTESQVHAIRIVEAIEKKLNTTAFHGSTFVKIARKFCGEGWSASAACRHAGIENPRDTWHTIRLALGNLSVAISRTRLDRFGKKYDKQVSF